MISHLGDVAGVAGFEPAHGGIKSHCLTTWLHPSMEDQLTSAVCGIGILDPTPQSYIRFV